MKENYLNNKDIMKKVRKFAERQTEEFYSTGLHPENTVAFDFNGISIINPFWDETGRKEFADEEAYKYYGKENMNFFIKKVLEIAK